MSAQGATPGPHPERPFVPVIELYKSSRDMLRSLSKSCKESSTSTWCSQLVVAKFAKPFPYIPLRSVCGPPIESPNQGLGTSSPAASKAQKSYFPLVELHL
jgi:hypothetical protein